MSPDQHIKKKTGNTLSSDAQHYGLFPGGGGGTGGLGGTCPVSPGSSSMVVTCVLWVQLGTVQAWCAFPFWQNKARNSSMILYIWLKFKMWKMASRPTGRHALRLGVIALREVGEDHHPWHCFPGRWFRTVTFLRSKYPARSYWEHGYNKTNLHACIGLLLMCYRSFHSFRYFQHFRRTECREFRFFRNSVGFLRSFLGMTGVRMTLAYPFIEKK